MSAFGFAFMAHGNASFVQKFGVPCCSKSGAAWETGGFSAVEEFGSSDTVWAVGDTDCWDAIFRESNSMPPIGTWNFLVTLRWY